MKYAFVVSGKSPTTMPGGLGSYSYNVAKALRQLGYTVFVVGVSGEDEVIEGDFCTFVHVKSSLRKLASVSSFVMMRQLANRIDEIIVENDIQAALIYGAAIWGRVGNILKARHAGDTVKIDSVAAYFTTFRHEYAGQQLGCPAEDYGYLKALSIAVLCRVIDWFYVPKEHATLRELDRIIVHYESSRSILLEELPELDPQTIVKTPYFIDLYERQGDGRLKAPGSGQKITCICRQDPRKGINDLLHAVALLKARDVAFECVVAGDGPFRAANERLAHRLGITDVVSFPGFVSSVEAVLDETDIFVFPSVEEGSGAISLLEAMHKGLPIVTTRCDGIPEDFEHGRTGMLVEPKSPHELADAIEALLNDPALARSLGANVKADFDQRFSLAQMTDGLRGVLAQLDSRD